MSANGQKTPSQRHTYNYTAIVSGVFRPHRTSHLQGALPLGGNIGMLDGHVEWRKFDLMLPRVANSVPGTTPTFWW